MIRRTSCECSILFILACLMFPSFIAAAEKTVIHDMAKPGIVRTCVIGGMTMTGLWDEIVKRFEAKFPYKVALVSTGPRPKISKPFRTGKADFLVMHSGDITTDLVADGHGINMRACARNDLVLLGPASDPAGIRGLKDGAEALKRIATTKSTFLDVNSNGPREIGATL